MIPDIAIIISAYAIARLLNEYIFVGDEAQKFRVFVSLVALAIIGFFLVSIIDAGSNLSDLNI